VVFVDRPHQECAVPKSQVRKKKVYTPPADVRPAAATTSRKPSPTWLPISAVSLIVFGIAWLVVYYLSETAYPVASWGFWNLGVGFGALVAALLVLSRWR
jgi:Cell division protein CrgA